MSDTDNRKHGRYSTDVKVHFQIPYDFRAEVDITMTEQVVPQKFIGFSKNISTYGLCFESAREVRPGETLWMELHLPDSKDTVFMRGVARWSRENETVPHSIKSYSTGVEVSAVDELEVEKTVYFDVKYGVYWSELLERVLGGFSRIYKKLSAVIVARGILKNDDEKYLLLKRSAASKSFPSKWEFPGGKVEPGEHITSALKREFLEEASLEINPLYRYMEFTYERPQGKVEYKIFWVELIAGAAVLSDEHDDLGWFKLDELRSLDVSQPLVAVITSLTRV